MSDIAKNQEPTFTKELDKIIRSKISNENPLHRLNMLIRDMKDFCKHAEELKESFRENRNDLYEWINELQDSSTETIKADQE